VPALAQRLAGDPELVKVAEVWLLLAPEIRAAVLALVR